MKNLKKTTCVAFLGLDLSIYVYLKNSLVTLQSLSCLFFPLIYVRNVFLFCSGVLLSCLIGG
jgi:hypothetical protein